MNVSFGIDDIRPIIETVVAEVFAQTTPLQQEQLAFIEPEAAALMGIHAHQLRDARLRGEITPTKVGGRIGYEKTEIVAYLARNRSA